MSRAFPTKNLVYIVVAILVAAGILIFSQYSNLSYTPPKTETAGTTQPTQTEQPTQQAPQQTPQETQTITGSVTSVKEFTVHGHSFAFDQKMLTVNKGNQVKITFIADDSSHDICVEKYGCSNVISKGQTTTLEFVAKESGNLKFWCSIAGHRQSGMEGDFVIQ